MGTITYQIPQAGQPNATEDAKVATALTTLLTFANGGIDASNLSALLAQSASVNQAGQVVKGVVNIATSESRTNTAYGTLPTPDQVTGIVLPTNGLIAVSYRATWQESVNNTASAAIFLGANQLVAADGASASPVTSPGTAMIQAGAANINKALTSYPLGLTCLGFGSTTAYTGDVTTGQALGMSGSSSFYGGPCLIEAAAGTYTVSVQFKSTSGTVTVSNRRLRVRVLSFS